MRFLLNKTEMVTISLFICLFAKSWSQDAFICNRLKYLELKKPNPDSLSSVDFKYVVQYDKHCLEKPNLTNNKHNQNNSVYSIDVFPIFFSLFVAGLIGIMAFRW